MSANHQTLLRRTTCPHCWTSFATEDVLWISSHADLLGDGRLGPEQQVRFLPTRFTVDGDALDARGFVCQNFACPRCHLTLPRALLETEPTFLSILGNPACGKSFFLTASVYQLRRLLPKHFGLSFTDADTVSNRILQEYEESLFLSHAADQLVPLANLIPKTQLHGELYDTVMYGNQQVSYPRPFLFAVLPQENHPKRYASQNPARVLCLYDNAGEHFKPGQETTGSPVTQHMARARVLLFLFDPLQDPRFHRLLPRLNGAAVNRAGRQESILLEAAARVRRLLKLPQNAKHDQPLIVVLTKFDAWYELLDEPDIREPYLAKENQLATIDLERVHRQSSQCRALMNSVCPELIHAAEGFAEDVVYIPVSALGHTPEPAADGKGGALRPGDVRPLWATVPFLYSMCRWMPGLVEAKKHAAATSVTRIVGMNPAAR